MPGSTTLIHRGRKGSYETFEPGSTLHMKGNLIGGLPLQTYHIDGTLGVDTNDGFSWGSDSAYKTIGKFMTVAAALGTRGRVRGLVAPGGYNEDIVLPLNTECPFGQLIAWNPGEGTPSFGAAWLSPATDTPTIHVRARGWLIQGFEIDAHADDGCVRLDSKTSNCNASGTIIRDNLFWGAGSADFGIDSLDGSHFVKVIGNRFVGIDGTALMTSSTDTAPGSWELAHNAFGNNANHVNAALWAAWIHDNGFMRTGDSYTATLQLDLRGGKNNTVGPHNVLGGTYGNAHGYYAGTDDDWYGNYGSAGVTSGDPS